MSAKFPARDRLGFEPVNACRAWSRTRTESACDDGVMETARVDRWVWAVRLTKTRSQATEACRAGHVTVGGVTVKASTRLCVGDRVEVVVGRRTHIVDVTRLIDKRVGAAVAATCYVDHSPPPPERDASPVFAREPGAGRPTKRDRRALDRLRGRGGR